MTLDLSEQEAEALRRLLWGWTLAGQDREALTAVENRLGAPTQQAWDRLCVPRESWERALQEPAR